MEICDEFIKSLWAIAMQFITNVFSTAFFMII